MPFDDNSGRVVAYNTFAKCSRRWFDFDITLRRRRQLRNQETFLQGAGIFEVLESTKDTVVGKDGCNAWMNERKESKDILQRTGTFSTVVIKTEKISLHVEYKQEWERCNAHDLDIWITEVDPEVAEEPWEGIIGETKNLGIMDKAEKRFMGRMEALKFEDDEDYEVISSYSTECKACVVRNN